MRTLLSLFILIFTLSASQVFSQQQPGRSADLLDSAWTDYTNNKFTEAEQKLLLIGTGDSNYVLSRARLAMVYYNSEQYQKGIDVCRKALMFPTIYEADFINQIGNCYLGLEDYKKARETFKQGSAKFPFEPIFSYNTAQSFYRQKNYDSTYHYLINTVKINPFYSNSHYLLGHMAVAQGQVTKAFLAWEFYLQIKTEGTSAKNVLSYLETISGNGEVVKKEDLIKPFMDNAHFNSIDQLIKGEVALNKNYKTKVSVDGKVIKQTQLLFDQLNYKAGTNDFYMDFYARIFSEIKKSGLQIPFTWICLASSNIEKVNTWVKKNKDDVDKTFIKERELINEYLSPRVVTLAGKKEPLKAWYLSDGKIEALGNVADNDVNKKLDYWRYYYKNGQIQAEGNYNDQYQMDGEWIFYNENGVLDKKLNYSGAKLNGNASYFDDFGKLITVASYKDGKVDGSGTNYFACGAVKKNFNYVNGVLEGASKVYYYDGRHEGDYNYVNDMLDGDLKRYYANGNPMYVETVSKGKINGPYKDYHENGQLNSEGSYDNGKLVGEWTYYYDNGKILRKDIYGSADKLEGKSVAYHRNGNIEEERLYENGLATGEWKSYDEDGKLYYTVTFIKDKVTGFTYFDKSGNQISKAENKKGDFKLTGYHPEGQKLYTGEYKKGNRHGEWTYYNINGAVTRSIQFNDGARNGVTTEYFYNGSIQNKLNYVNGKASGLYQAFYTDGQIENQGFMVNDEEAGTWTSYYPDGTLKSRRFYVAGTLEGCYEEFAVDGKPERDVWYKNGKKTLNNMYDTTSQVVSRMNFATDTGLYAFNFINGKKQFECRINCSEYNGPAKWFHINGAVASEFTMVFDEKEGLSRSYFSDKVIETEGLYKSGKRTGLWKVYHRNGKLESTGNYLKGSKDSLWMFYFDNGNKELIAFYKDGEREDASTYFNYSGEELFSKYYKDGEIIGYSAPGENKQTPLTNGSGTIKLNFKNGLIAVEEIYKNGYMDGLQKSWYSNGKPYSERSLKNGDRHGKTIYYYPDGKVMKELNYVQDVLDGLIKYYRQDGSVEKEEMYKNGLLNGYTVHYDPKGSVTKKDFYWNDNIYMN